MFAESYGAEAVLDVPYFYLAVVCGGDYAGGVGGVD